MSVQRRKGVRLEDHPKSIIWPLLVEAQIELELAGKPAAPQDVWRRIRLRDEAALAEDIPLEPGTIPKWVLGQFDLPSFQEFRNLRLDKAAMPLIEPVAILKSLVQSVAKLANAEALEQLILDPGSVPFEQKRMIAKDATTLFMDKFSPKLSPETGERVLPSTLAEAMVDNVTDREEEMLAAARNLPPELQARLDRKWKLDSMKAAQERTAKLRGS